MEADFGVAPPEESQAGAKSLSGLDLRINEQQRKLPTKAGRAADSRRIRRCASRRKRKLVPMNYWKRDSKGTCRYRVAVVWWARRTTTEGGAAGSQLGAETVRIAGGQKNRPTTRGVSRTGLFIQKETPVMLTGEKSPRDQSAGQGGDEE